MRTFIYKSIFLIIIFIIGFEFTIGKRIDPIVGGINKISNEQGRKDLINKLRKEMRKGLTKENILKDDDRILIYSFLNKLNAEINSPREK